MTAKSEEKTIEKPKEYALVWAFQQLKELNNETGFVQVEKNLAEKLIKKGDVQCTSVGGNALKYIEAAKIEAPEPTKEKKQNTTKSKNNK